MKTPRPFRSLLIIAYVGLTAITNTQAQTWQMLLPGPSGSGSPTGNGNDVLLNPFIASPASGVFLATGDSGSATASLFRVTSSDSTFSNFTIEPLDSGWVRACRLAYKPNDGLYAAGDTAVSSGSKKGSATSLWKIRKSREADKGNPGTWQDDDTFQLSAAVKSPTQPVNSRAMGIAADRDGKITGNVFVCGWASDGKVNHWIIRQKSSAGTWTTVLDTKAADVYSIPYKMCFVPQGGNNPAAALFVAGILNDRWTVLRSQNQGASWQPVGPWPADGSQASACDVGGDSQGNIYVVGVRGRDGYNRGWVLRRSLDGGDTWQDLLDQPSQSDSWAVRLAIDAGNNITLSGAIDNAGGNPRWAIVRNSPGQSWSDSWAARTFPLGENTSGLSKGRGMAADPSGNLFLTGDVSNWTDPIDGMVLSGTGLLRMVP